MAFSIETIKEEIHDMVDYWERELQDHLYEEYENIKQEIITELYNEILEEVDKDYRDFYNFSLLSKERNKTKISNVYFISDGEFCKIGKADNVDVRLKQLQTSNAKPLFVIGYIPCKNPTSALRKEDAFHMKFSKSKASGEWYKIDISKAIDEIKKQNGIILLESEE